MNGSASSFIRMFALALALVSPVLASAGLNAQPAATTTDVQPEKTPAQIRAERARNRLADNPTAQDRAADTLSGPPEVDPELIEFFRDTMTELSGPEYEGRAPGSAGIDRAATYIEDHFRTLGFQPAFPNSQTAADGTEVLTPRSGFRQHFGVGQQTRAGTAAMTVDAQELVHTVDFSVLAYSGSGDVTAPVAFAGYAIASGPDDYSGFDPNTRFDDKIVLALAYEPMNPDGTSRWQTKGFSRNAQLTQKANALVRRGAKAVVFVKPPNAADDRAGILETVDSTRPGRGGSAGAAGSGNRMTRFDVPVIQVTPEIAQRLLNRAADPDRSLEALIARANDGPISLDLPGDPVSLRVQMETTSTDAFNVGAILPGTGALADNFVIIGAHYDHVGFGGIGSFPGNEGVLHPGADDNASGTAGMMLVAKLLSERVRTLPPEQPRRSILFLAFSAEEMGLLGSLHYTQRPIVPHERVVLMLNLDMIGTLDDEPLEIGNLRSAPELPSIVDPHFERSGLLIARETSVGNARSDHASFDAVGVPNLFFFTGLHPRYHRPQDTPDLIDSEGATRIALLVTDIAVEAATRIVGVFHRSAGAPAAPGEPTVRIGLLPTNSPKGGILVQRVFPDTSASAAGIQPNDRLLTWNGAPLRSVEDLRPRLSQHKPGDVVTITLERGDETVEVEMTLRGIE